MLTKKNNNSIVKEYGIKKIIPKCNNILENNLKDFGEIPFLYRKIRLLNQSGIIEEVNQ